MLGGVLRSRHYGMRGNNRRKRDIEAARAICKSSGCALELQPRSVADPPCSGMCCPSCGKAGIRLVAFTDAAGVLHMTVPGQCHAIPHENSPGTPSIALASCVPAKPSLDTLGLGCCLRVTCQARLGPSGSLAQHK